MTRRHWAVITGIGAAVLVASGVAFVGRHHVLPGARHPQDNASMRPPTGQRVVIEVINATRVHGLALQAREFLRGQGFDVVDLGTTTELRDSTIVLDRSQHPDWARRVAAALGGVRVETRTDSSHFVDATVLLGSSWHPPTEPFHP